MSIYSDAVLADSPDVYFRLSETGAGPLVDVIAAHNATPNTTIVTGASLLATDTNAGITVDRNTGFTNAVTTYSVAQVPMTVEFWIKVSSLTGAAYCCTCNTGSDGWTVSYTNATGAWSVKEWGGSVYDFTGAVSNGTTQHVVCVWSAANAVSLYLNGTFSQTIAGGAAMVATAAALTIGNATSGPQAILDEMAIYKSALTADRIAAHYRLGKSGRILASAGVGA